MADLLSLTNNYMEKSYQCPLCKREMEEWEVWTHWGKCKSKLQRHMLVFETFLAKNRERFFKANVEHFNK